MDKEVIKRKFYNSKLFNTIYLPSLGNVTQEQTLNDIIECLENGAEVNAVDLNNDRNTILHVAIRNGYQVIVKYLLEKSQIRTDIKNDIGQTALTLAQSADVQIKTLVDNFKTQALKYKLTYVSNQTVLRVYIGNCQLQPDALIEKLFSEIIANNEHLFFVDINIIAFNFGYDNAIKTQLSLVTQPLIVQFGVMSSKKVYFRENEGIHCIDLNTCISIPIHDAEIFHESNRFGLKLIIQTLQLKLIGEIKSKPPNLLSAVFKLEKLFGKLTLFVHVIKNADVISLKLLCLNVKKLELPMFETAAIVGNEEKMSALMQMEQALSGGQSVLFNEKKEHLLRIGVEACNLDIIDFMLKSGAKLEENMVNDAWKYKRYEMVLLLLKFDYMFPFDFDLDSIKGNEKFHQFVTNRIELHEDITNSSQDDIKLKLDSIGKSKTYLNTANESALFSALNCSRFDIYIWLVNDYKLDFRDPDEKDCLPFNIIQSAKETRILNLFPTINAHIRSLVSRSKSANKLDNLSKLVKVLYKKLDDIPEVSVVLKVVQYSYHLNIIYDMEKNSAEGIALTGSSVKGECDYITGNIYIGGKVDENELLGSIAHELTHLAMELVYGNYCNPYKQDDNNNRDYKEIVDHQYLLCHQQNADDIIKNVFIVYPSKEWDKELIVRVNHIIAKHGIDNGRRILSKQASELYQYYQSVVVPSFEVFIKEGPLMKLKFDIRKLNDVSGVMNFIQESRIQLIESPIKEQNQTSAPLLFLVTGHVLLSTIRLFSRLKGDLDSFLIFQIDQYDTKIKHIHTVFSHDVCKMLILQCEKEPNKEFDKRLGQLSDILENKSNKKVIILMKPFNDLENYFSKIAKTLSVKLDWKFDKEFSHRELSAESIEMLLKRTVSLQNNKLDLNSFIDKNSFHVVDLDTLTKLICKNNVNLGKMPITNKDYNERYYIKRKLDYKVISDSSSVKKSYEEIDLLSDKHKFVLVSDTAGMGKTTLLTNITHHIRNKYPGVWIVRVNLGDCSRILDGTPKFKADQPKIQFLIDQLFESKSKLKLETSFEKRLLSHLIENVENKVIMMFDGLDETTDELQTIIIDLLLPLKQTKIKQIWLTTRPHLLDNLKNNLSEYCYTIQPFTNEDQVWFLTTFWSSRSEDIDVGKVKKYSRAILERLSASISDKDKKFTGIPLQCKMLAESYERDMREYCTSNKPYPVLPDKINLLDLYNKFFDYKYDIYQCEKNNFDLSKPNNKTLYKKLRDDYLRDHQFASLLRIFNENNLPLLLTVSELEDTKHYLKQIENKELNTGLIEIVVKDMPRFVHLTYAEFLAAKYIVHKIMTQPITQLVKFVIITIFMSPMYVVTRAFIDTHLTNYEFNDNVLDDVAQIMKEFLNFSNHPESNLSQFPYNDIIHQAADEGNVRIIDFMLKCSRICNAVESTVHTTLHRAARSDHAAVINMLISNGYNVNAITEYNITPLYIAANYNCLKAVECLSIAQGVDFNIPDQEGKTALIMAASVGHFKVIDILIRFVEVDVNATDNEGCTALHWAASFGFFKTVECLLKAKSINVNAVDEDMSTPLESAQFNGYESIVKLLEKANENDDTIDKEGGTPLHLAVLNNDVVSASLLAEFTKINDVNKKGCTPLHLAASTNCTKWIEHLLKANDINVNAVDNNGCTPLLSAVLRNHYQSVELLVKVVGIDANLALSVDGWTSLHKAAFDDRFGIIQLLKQVLNIDLNITDKIGRTPLHLASSCGNLESIKLLATSANIIIEAADRQLRTALHRAVHNNHYTSIEYLLTVANKNAVDHEGRTPLHYAASCKNFMLIELLLKAGANVNIHDKQGNSPLHETIYFSDVEAMNLLLKADNIDINAADGDRKTPLHVAIGSDCLDLTQRLLETNGININAVDCNGSTPLHVASSMGDLKKVELLLESSDININAINNTGKTPLQLAEFGNHQSVIKALLRRGAEKAITKGDHLHIAVYKNDLTSFENLLSDDTYDVNQVSSAGDTALHVVASKGNTTMAERLLNWNGINVNAVDTHHRTPLYRAVFRGHTNIVELLLNADGIDVNVANDEGSTALHIAAYDGDHISIQLLLTAKGILVNTVDNVGWTPLHWTAFRDDCISTELLLSAPDIATNAVDKTGLTPLDLATKNNCQRVAKLLCNKKKVQSPL